jgi:hypothetical protein
MNENSKIKYDLLKRIRDRGLEEAKKDYMLYGLRENPFSKSGIAPDNPVIFTFDEKQFNAIMDTISDSFVNDQFGGTVILGEYGMGKTHTVKYIAKQINEQLGNLPEAGKAIYLKNPRSSMVQMVSGLYDGIGRESLRQLIKAPILEDKRLAEEIIQGNIVENVHRLLYETVEDDYVAELLATFTFGQQPDCDYAWDALLGATRKGLPKVKDVRPEQFINSLFLMLRSRGCRHIYVLIDEFEDLPGSALSRTKKRDYAVGLRDIIDRNTEGFSLIIASNAAPWEEVKELLPPLVNRFGLTIRINNLTNNEACRLVGDYIEPAREVKKDGPLFPFDEEAIYMINEQEGGVKRFVLQRCYDCIEKGISNSWERIEADKLSEISIKNREKEE